MSKTYSVRVENHTEVPWKWLRLDVSYKGDVKYDGTLAPGRGVDLQVKSGAKITRVVYRENLQGKFDRTMESDFPDSRVRGPIVVKVFPPDEKSSYTALY